MSGRTVDRLWLLVGDLWLADRVYAPMLRPGIAFVQVLFPSERFRRSVQDDDFFGAILTLLCERFRTVAIKVFPDKIDGFLTSDFPTGVIRNVGVWDKDVAILTAPASGEPDLAVNRVHCFHQLASGRVDASVGLTPASALYSSRSIYWGYNMSKSALAHLATPSIGMGGGALRKFVENLSSFGAAWLDDIERIDDANAINEHLWRQEEAKPAL